MSKRQHIAFILFMLIISVLIPCGCATNQSDTVRETVKTSTVKEESEEMNVTAPPETVNTSSIPDEMSLFTIEPQFDSAWEFNEYGFATAYIGSDNTADGEYFYITEQGKRVSNPLFGINEEQKYGMPLFADFGLDRFPEGDLWGYVNENNEVVIPAQYEAARPFSAIGLAGVSSGGKWGYINNKNEMVIEPQFDQADDFFENGTAAVSVNGKLSLIDSTGKIIKNTDYLFDYIYSSSVSESEYQKKTGLLLCFDGKTSRYGLINVNGEEVLAAEYTEIIFRKTIGEGSISWGDHGTGLIMFVDENGMIGLVSQSGSIVLEPVSAYGIAFGDKDLALVEFNDYTSDYINLQGNFITNKRYDYAGLFSENGLAVVCEDQDEGKFGYINTSGDYEIEPVFDRADEFSSAGLAYAQKGDQTGLINPDGEFMYTANGEIRDLQVIDDLFQIRYEDRTEYVSGDGEIVKTMPAGTYYYFPEYGTYLIQEDEKIGMLDSEGNYIIEPLYRDVSGKWNTNDWEGYRLQNDSTADLLVTFNDAGYMGLITCDGKEILPAVFEYIESVSANGMILVRKDGKYGYCKFDNQT